jgi:hypothetical protein
MGRDVLVQKMEALAEIIAGAKRTSGAAQNDNFDRGVLDREIDRGLKFVRHGRDNGVEFIWTIKRNRRDRTITAVDKRLECHGVPLTSVLRCLAHALL